MGTIQSSTLVEEGWSRRMCGLFPFRDRCYWNHRQPQVCTEEPVARACAIDGTLWFLPEPREREHRKHEFSTPQEVAVESTVKQATF